MLPLVIDVNVVISAAFNKGNSLQVFTLNKKYKRFDFIAPQFLYIEISKHTSRIAQKTKYSLAETMRILNFVIEQIRFIPDDNFKDKIAEADTTLRYHKKDIHYLALALKFNCEILSGDKTFKTLCPDIVKNPREILESF